MLCQGESVFAYMLVNSLLSKKLGAHRWQSGLRNLKVLSAVSERKVVEIVDGDVTQKKSEHQWTKCGGHHEFATVSL